MRKMLVLFGIYFIVSYLVSGPAKFGVAVGIFYLLRICEYKAIQNQYERMLQLLNEQSLTLETLQAKLEDGPISLPEIVAAVLNGTLIPDEYSLYRRLREWSSDPDRPLHPFSGIKVSYPGDELLPKYFALTPNWKVATELDPGLVQERRSWGQTQGEPGSSSELVRLYTVRITEAGRKYLSSSEENTS